MDGWAWVEFGRGRNATNHILSIPSSVPGLLPGWSLIRGFALLCFAWEFCGFASPVRPYRSLVRPTCALSGWRLFDHVCLLFSCPLDANLADWQAHARKVCSVQVGEAVRAALREHFKEERENGRGCVDVSGSRDLKKTRTCEHSTRSAGSLRRADPKRVQG
eukprot:365047-Chlamydomonas_euryale.AAC.10